MGRKKKENKKIEPPAMKNTDAAPGNTAVGPDRPDQPDLSQLSGDWQEFYRLVIDKVR